MAAERTPGLLPDPPQSGAALRTIQGLVTLQAIPRPPRVGLHRSWPRHHLKPCQLVIAAQDLVPDSHQVVLLETSELIRLESCP